MHVLAKLRNTSTLQPAEQAGVQLNAYRLDTAVTEVHKYELKFFATNKKGEEKDLSRGQKNEYGL
jgi:hypothetical protein